MWNPKLMLRNVLCLLAVLSGLAMLPAPALADVAVADVAGADRPALELAAAADVGTMTATQPRSQGDFPAPTLSAQVPQARPLAQVAAYYTWQGVLHILGGWDHLCFVLCLCLLARGRFLLTLVTTFTVGHSLSLALAFFDVIHVPVPPVEAVIALSIAFMAREALLAHRQGAPQGPEVRRRQFAITAAFGLLHGLGFATVLRELGVAPGERVSGLLFFNAGVELGQLVFVGAVLGAMGVAGAFDRREPVRRAALYFAAIVGCFWAIERVAGIGLGAVLGNA